MVGPPVVARWLLEHAMNPAAAEAIAGDLAEAFQSRIARGATVLRARLWYWREALVAILWQWRGAPEVNEPASRRRTMTDTLFTEVKQTLRSLRRSPGFSLGAIVPIALALALATSVFAVVHGSQPRYTVPEARDDARRALRFVRHHARDYGIDPDRLGACGASSGGLLFESTDEMLAAMRRMLADPELRGRLARAGRRAYEERWSEAAVVPQYLELVRRVAERKGESRTVETLMTASVA